MKTQKKQPGFLDRKTLLINIMIAFFAALCVLLVADVFYRFALPPKKVVMDDYLGWRANPNYTFSGERARMDGSTEMIAVSFQERGFRAYGNVNTTHPKVLFVGDSFTQAIDASDDETYYTQLGQLLVGHLSCLLGLLKLMGFALQMSF